MRDRRTTWTRRGGETGRADGVEASTGLNPPVVGELLACPGSRTNAIKRISVAVSK